MMEIMNFDELSKGDFAMDETNNKQRLSIRYVKGDVLEPIGEGKKFIIHCCNDVGAFGAGVALAIRNKWPSVCKRYREWGGNDKEYKLGTIQAVRVDKDIFVINMIGQSGIKKMLNIPPIRYAAIEKCLKKIAVLAKEHKATIHAPRFGAGLAGGEWEKIEGIIKEQLTDKDVAVTIYDFD